MNYNAAHKVTSTLDMPSGEAAGITLKVGIDIIVECKTSCSRIVASV